MFDDVLIMAGGSGTRLWPASSSRLPKQFLPVNEEDKKTFFFMALERAFALTGSTGRIIVIAGSSHITHVLRDAAKLRAAEKKRLYIIEEPAAKNTAPAIACAMIFSLLSGKKRKMLVLTSDHIIKPLEIFKSDAALAAAAVENDKLAVFGIPPSKPETGYGYIETAGETAGKKTLTEALNVKKFHEKPDLKTAKKYSASSRFFWNSGMFAFTVSFMKDEFLRLAPEVFLPFEKLKSPDFELLRGIKLINNWKGLENAYKKTQSISFDYAIAEKCSKTVMVRTNFEWIDIGNWDEYIKICGSGNAKTEGSVFNTEENSCFVDSDIPVALAGVNDLIVVIRSGKNGEPASALITRKGQTQKVKDAVELIKKSELKGIL